MADRIVSCTASTVESVRRHVNQIHDFVGPYKWIIDAYVSDFFHLDLWSKLPLQWQTFLGSLSTQELSWLLDSQVHIGSAVPPLSLLAYRKCAHSLALSRDCIDMNAEDVHEKLQSVLSTAAEAAQTGSHDNNLCFKSASQESTSLTSSRGLSGSGVRTLPERLSADVVKNGQYLALDPLLRRHVKPKKQHEILQLGKAVSRLCSHCGCDRVVDVGAGLGHLSRLLTFGQGLKVTTVEATGGHAPKAEKFDRDVQKEMKKAKQKRKADGGPPDVPQRPVPLPETEELPHHVVATISTNISTADFLSTIQGQLSRQHGTDTDDKRHTDDSLTEKCDGDVRQVPRCTSVHPPDGNGVCVEREEHQSDRNGCVECESGCKVRTAKTEHCQQSRGNLRCGKDGTICQVGNDAHCQETTRSKSNSNAQTVSRHSPLADHVRGNLPVSDISDACWVTFENGPASTCEVLESAVSEELVMKDRLDSISKILEPAMSEELVMGDRLDSTSKVLEPAMNEELVMGDRPDSTSKLLEPAMTEELVMGDRLDSTSKLLEPAMSEELVMKDRPDSSSKILDSAVGEELVMKDRPDSTSRVLDSVMSEELVIEDRLESSSKVLDSAVSEELVMKDRPDSTFKILDSAMSEELVMGNRPDSTSKVLEPAGDSKLVMVGLHACGDLTATMLRVFVHCPSVVGLASVACCYMKLSTDSSVGKERTEIGFPMSGYVSAMPHHHLTYAAREMACHFADSYNQRLKESPPHLRIHGYRAALQHVIMGLNPNYDNGCMKLTIKNAVNMPFEQYVHLGLQRLGMGGESARVSMLTQEAQSLLPRWRQVVALYTLRLALGPVLETLLLLDRMLYLQEQGISSILVPIFNPDLSPRNFVLLARKST